MDTNILSLIASSVSIILGILAIGITIYFYEKTKKTEINVAKSLAKIEAETGTLQKVTSTVMQKLTDYATTEQHNPLVDSIERLLELQMSMGYDTRNINIPSNDGASLENLKAELITCYLIIHNRAAILNYLAKRSLPYIEDYDPADEIHALFGRLVDTSCDDFLHLDKILTYVTEEELNLNPLISTYHETQEIWKPMVQTTAEAYQKID